MIGQKLGSFRIESELGSGAMGVVYKGVREGSDRPAAIKIIAAEQMGKGKAFERFLREATILEQFKHPNIVRYLARGKSGGTYYYAMEFVSGPTLDKVLAHRETLPWREVVGIAIQLCDALHYAHEHGVVHRDLKPSNLMVTEKGQLKLTDFGIAKDLDATALTGTGRTLGTAAYMAPEQIRGTPEISHKTDLYALGAVLYQMLTGSPPFSGASAVVLMHAHINQAPPRASAKVEEIPKALDDLIVNLMAKAPSDRPWDASAVAQVLRELKEKDDRKQPVAMVWPDPGTAASMPTRAEAADPMFTGVRPPKKKGKKARGRGKWLEVGGLVAGLLVVGGLIAYVVWPPGDRYLHAHAEALMASADPLDWLRARDEYLAPLDRRFPHHAYKAQTEAWLDRIDLRDADRRAENLEKTNLAAFSKPKNEAEALFQTTFVEASAARNRHHDVDAHDLWRRMEAQLIKDGREDRGWLLLARNRAEAIAKEVRHRHEVVSGLLAKATIPDQLATSEAAQKYRLDLLRDVVARFEKYPDVADLVTIAKAALPPEPPGEGDRKKSEPPKG